MEFIDDTATKLLSEVNMYLKTKFAKDVLLNNSEPYRYIIKGVKRRMWFKVVKPELQRIAANHLYELVMLVEKPSNDFIEFTFEEVPVPRLSRVSNEPPLTGEELRTLRKMINEWKQKKKPLNI